MLPSGGRKFEAQREEETSLARGLLWWDPLTDGLQLPCHFWTEKGSPRPREKKELSGSDCQLWLDYSFQFLLLSYPGEGSIRPVRASLARSS